MVTNSPLLTVRLIWSRAVFSPKNFETFLISIIGLFSLCIFSLNKIRVQRYIYIQCHPAFPPFFLVPFRKKGEFSSDIYAGNKCKVITFLQKSDVFQATSLRVRRLAKNRRTSSPLTRKAVTAIHTMRTTEGVPSGSRAAKRSYPICTKTKWQR